MNKKYLPLIFLGIGLVIFVIAFVFVRSKNKPREEVEEESTLMDVSFKDRPVVSLTPDSDGHYLKLLIDKIKIPAKSLDYELLYETNEITQGVPGTLNLEGGSKFEVNLLLGSESSGKFRYDTGVEKGSVTLRFRNADGKLIARFVTEFHMQTNTDKVTSLDESFSYELDKKSAEYFVTMNTVGLPGSVEQILSGPYGVFTSFGSLPPGSTEASWQKASDSIFYK